MIGRGVHGGVGPGGEVGRARLPSKHTTPVIEHQLLPEKRSFDFMMLNANAYISVFK